jgi:hypothetical protein
MPLGECHRDKLIHKICPECNGKKLNIVVHHATAPEKEK